MTDNKDLMEKNELSMNARGGTELMLERLYTSPHIPREVLEKFQIIPSRVRELKDDKYRILWMHDLAEDPETHHLANEGWARFHRIVFVSNWQAQSFINRYQIPWSRCVVLLNAINPIPVTEDRDDSIIKLVYHTTPHRGLNILLPVFDKLCERYDNIHLDLFSSYKLYGWGQRDEQFQELFDQVKANPKITNHGTVAQEDLRRHLSQSHIFAYPSTWSETSCLCLMEAMSAGLVCVHPNFGGLYETAANWTSMYNFHEDLNQHAQLFYLILGAAIDGINSENTRLRVASQKKYADAFYNWEGRAHQWHSFLMSVLESGEPLDMPKEQFVYSY